MAFFSNQVVLITGAASGLGRQLALDLAREGAVIAAVDLKEEPLTRLAAELGGKRTAWGVADVTDAGAIRNAALELGGKLGAIDILIANAGIGRDNSALNFRAEDFNAQVQVNLLGVANSVAAVLPEMIERRRGHLVGISSLASYRGLPRMLGYCASKAGVTSLLEGLRVELKGSGIAVTTICPGWIKTALTANIPVPHLRIMEVTDATARIVKAIEQRRAYYAFPPVMVRRLRLLKWLPAGISDWLTLRAMGRLKKR